MSFPNLLIIVLDTMRLDIFKSLEEKNMKLEKLGFINLNNGIAPSSWTLPSHASLFTGEYPSIHKAHETLKIKSHDIDKIRLKSKTFVSKLNKIGYTSYAISANPYVSPKYGFSDFDYFYDETFFIDIFRKFQKESKFISKFEEIKYKSIMKWPIEKGGKNIIKNIIKTDFNKPYFLFINLMEVHDPYLGIIDKDMNNLTFFKKILPTNELVTTWKNLYFKAAKMAYFYSVKIAEYMLNKYGENNFIVITSDHGQCFGENNFFGHGTFLYDELIKIPISIKFPEKQNQNINKVGYTSLVNIKSLLFDVIKSRQNPLNNFIKKSVYSQSFGIPGNIKFSKEIDIKKIIKYDKKKLRTLKV